MTATFIAPSSTLRHALIADALTSGGAAVLHLAGGASLAAAVTALAAWQAIGWRTSGRVGRAVFSAA